MDELEIAAVKALESVLLSTPTSILNENDGDDTSTVREEIFFIAKMLMADITAGQDGSEHLNIASVQLIGSNFETVNKAEKEERIIPTPTPTSVPFFALTMRISKRLHNQTVPLTFSQ